MSGERTGIMLYCYKKDEGILIMGKKIPSNIYEKLGDYYEWEDIGTFKIDKNEIVTLYPEDSNWMKDLAGGWKNRYFLDNIYDQNMNHIVLSRTNGIVLKCFETDETCLLVSNKIPMKGLSNFQTKARRPSLDWEDIGTFHIESNKIIYHDNVEEDDIDLTAPLYDANFMKINIPSY